MRSIVYLLRQRRNIIVPSGTLHCEALHLRLVATSFCVRKRTMKLSYAQMKFATKVAKRSCVLRTQTQKTKDFFRSPLFFGGDTQI